MRLKITTLCLLAGTGLVVAQTTLTNDSVIKMVKAGLSDDVIISTMKAQSAQYSTDPDALIALKTAGVDDAVIKAMIDRMGASATAAPEPAPNTEAKATIYVYRNRFLSGPAPNSPSVSRGLCTGSIPASSSGRTERAVYVLAGVSTVTRAYPGRPEPNSNRARRSRLLYLRLHPKLRVPLF
jgi:hypothetical protein